MRTASSAMRDMQRVCIGIGIDRDGGDAEPFGGAHHPHGNLAPIGYEEL